MGAIKSRVEKLEADHRAIDTKIAKEQKRPQPDSMVIKSLKRQKLRLKEALKMLKAQAS